MTTSIDPITTQTQIEESEELASLEHGKIGSLLNWHLSAHVYPNKLGAVFISQTTFKVLGIPATRYPDVSFVSAERLPKNLRVEADFAPDLAVEVVSKNDTDFEIEERVIQYQKSGVKLIWVIHPVSQTVAVYHPADPKPLPFGITDELDGENVVPGFKLKVIELFQ